MIERLRKYRRDLHQIPELGFKEFKTKNYILQVLKQYPCEITEVAKTGICAFFPSKDSKSPETVAFRCDMDGLSTEEKNQVPYRSIHPGIMHACGHDGHMAMLLGLAGELANMNGIQPVNVLLIFQPAEENPGGAKHIVESGILEKYEVRRIFAFHIGPSATPHSIASRPKEFMAKSCEINITIHGKSAHCSAAHKGIDALHIGCIYLNHLYEMENTLFPPSEFRLLKFGRMLSGAVRNAISDKTVLEGTLRSFRLESFDLLQEQIHTIATKYEQEYGCSIEINCTEGYPPTLNDPLLFEAARDALATADFLSDSEFITLRKPSMSSDDFSYYIQRVPGLYMCLGTGEKTPLHSSTFDFDESILETGVKAYLKLLNLPPQNSYK
ncbi:MAG: M20 family metallopeptidase [Eubacteriales bacterium]|nr:M20 family metallopeptidase [Eubacteriales bacterium]